MTSFPPVIDAGILSDTQVNTADQQTNDSGSIQDDSESQPGRQRPNEEIAQTSIPSTECRFCFMDPCVVNNRQSWLPLNPVHPHIRNKGIRKAKYRKFWSLIQRRCGWNTPRYNNKKQRMLRRDLNLDDDDETWVSYGGARDIIPDDVLDEVRHVYPNPSGVPYMGHRWS